jgi:hypothetical protein
MLTGLAAARKGLQSVRDAAYPDYSRDCGRIASAVGTARSGSAGTTRGHAALVAAAAARQKQIDALKGSIALTRKAAVTQPKGAAPSQAEIAAAISAASQQATDAATSLASARAWANESLARAREMAANAGEIQSKVC